jgi:hypothetical protein
MAYEPEWGRVPKTKQEVLPLRRTTPAAGQSHPAWTEVMRAAHNRCRTDGGKWFSMPGIHR